MNCYNDFCSGKTQEESISSQTDNLLLESNFLSILVNGVAVPVTGFQQPESGSGAYLFVRNRSTNVLRTLVLKNDDSGSEDGNRIATPTGVDYTIAAGSTAILLWDNGYWRVVL